LDTRSNYFREDENDNDNDNENEVQTNEVQTQVTTQLQTNDKHLPKAFVPATVAGIIAAIGTAGFFFIAFGPGSNLEGRGDGMISAAAATSAGATITPTVPSR
jgi:recombination DNA repair RAD52 pathway protein